MFCYLLVFGVVFVVAIAAMIMSVIKIQNRVKSVCVPCLVISSSIFVVAFSFFYLCSMMFMEVFSR